MATLTLRADLTRRLTNAEVDANFGALNTDLASKLSATANAVGLAVYDTRSVATGPALGQGVRFDFKSNTTDGLADGGSFHAVMSVTPWTDASGGGTKQLAFTSNDQLWIRGSGDAQSAFGAWKKVLDSGNFNSYALPLSGGSLSGSISLPSIAVGSTSPTDAINGSPWYGLGYTSTDLFSAGGQQVQLAGYAGLRLRSMGALLDVLPASVTTNATFKSGGQIRAAGWWGDTGYSVDGLALEIGVSGGMAHIYSYNRSTGARGPLQLNGTSLTLDAPGFTVFNGSTKLAVDSSGNIPTLGGFSPANGAIRLTPNLHLNPAAGNAVICSWDNGDNGSPGSNAFRVGNGAGADAFTVTYNGVANAAVMSAGRMWAGYDAAVSGAISCSNWFRTSGATGLYFASYSTGVCPVQQYAGAGYGSAATYGRTGAYAGFSLEGRVVFMHNGASTWGIYNDVSDTWNQYYDMATDACHFKGNVFAYSATISDRRLKRDITPIRSALDKLLQITGVTFRMIEDDKPGIGVIAQDVEAVFPEAVVHTKTPVSADKKSGGDEILTVAYGQLIGPVIEAIRELTGRVRRIEEALA